MSIFIAVLLAAGAAAAPEIANVAGPVNHWEPFLGKKRGLCQEAWRRRPTHMK
jgi:hypothetical protein